LPRNDFVLAKDFTFIVLEYWRADLAEIFCLIDFCLDVMRARCPVYTMLGIGLVPPFMRSATGGVWAYGKGTFATQGGLGSGFGVPGL
jgi:hypothetical protein